MSVQLAILGLLRQRDYHGYELKKSIEYEMGAWTDIKFGSIYHALGILRKAGFVRKVATTRKGGKPERSVYGITGMGEDEFHRLIIDNILTVRRIFLKEDIGVYFGGMLEKEEFADILEKRICLLGKLKTQLVDHREEIERYAPLIVNLAKLLVTHHIMHIDAELEWFRKIREELLAGTLVYWPN